MATDDEIFYQVMNLAVEGDGAKLAQYAIANNLVGLDGKPNAAAFAKLNRPLTVSGEFVDVTFPQVNTPITNWDAKAIDEQFKAIRSTAKITPLDALIRNIDHGFTLEQVQQLEAAGLSPSKSGFELLDAVIGNTDPAKVAALNAFKDTLHTRHPEAYKEYAAANPANVTPGGRTAPENTHTKWLDSTDQIQSDLESAMKKNLGESAAGLQPVSGDDSKELAAMAEKIQHDAESKLTKANGAIGAKAPHFYMLKGDDSFNIVSVTGIDDKREHAGQDILISEGALKLRKDNPKEFEALMSREIMTGLNRMNPGLQNQYALITAEIKAEVASRKLNGDQQNNYVEQLAADQEASLIAGSDNVQKAILLRQKSLGNAERAPSEPSENVRIAALKPQDQNSLKQGQTKDTGTGMQPETIADLNRLYGTGWQIAGENKSDDKHPLKHFADRGIQGTTYTVKLPGDRGFESVEVNGAGLVLYHEEYRPGQETAPTIPGQQPRTQGGQSGPGYNQNQQPSVAPDDPRRQFRNYDLIQSQFPGAVILSEQRNVSIRNQHGNWQGDGDIIQLQNGEILKVASNSGRLQISDESGRVRYDSQHPEESNMAMPGNYMPAPGGYGGPGGVGVDVGIGGRRPGVSFVASNVAMGGYCPQERIAYQQHYGRYFDSHGNAHQYNYATPVVEGPGCGPVIGGYGALRSGVELDVNIGHRLGLGFAAPNIGCGVFGPGAPELLVELGGRRPHCEPYRREEIVVAEPYRHMEIPRMPRFEVAQVENVHHGLVFGGGANIHRGR